MVYNYISCNYDRYLGEKNYESVKHNGKINFKNGTY